MKSAGLNILGLLVVGDEVTSSENIIEDTTQTNIIARIPVVDHVIKHGSKNKDLT